jgi:hypothetical protein
MTETTSMNRMIRERHVYAPPVARRPDVATVMAQGAVGFIAANFLLILARILLVYSAYNIIWLGMLAVVLVFAVAMGIPAGLFVWAGFEIAGNTLNHIYRSIIAVMIILLIFVSFALFLGAQLPPPDEQLWVLAMVLAPGIGVGLVTGSRLHLGHELVRGGDRVGVVLRVFSVITGVLLRLKVAVLFMASAITLICTLQSPDYTDLHRLWSLLAFAHFAGSMALLFARLKGDVLLPLGVIVNAPVIAALVKFPTLFPGFRWVAIAYLALWAVFLLTRWRQTQVAFSVLNEEFRYYLTD